MKAMWIATAAEIREIDRKAIQEFGIPSFALMEQAGFAVFRAVQELLPERGRTVVVCGKGNNGGDGLVVARLLREHGKPVDCFVAVSSESDLSGGAKEELTRATGAGVSPVFGSGDDWIAEVERALRNCDAVVDALLGTGAKGDLAGDVLAAVQAVNASGRPVIAVDIPTGIDCDTGQECGASIKASRTVTFGLPKPFLFHGEGLDRAGRWTVADIGYPPAIQGPTDALLLSPELVSHAVPHRPIASNKGQNGSLLVVAGSHDMPGAASIVAKAALRAGVGLVTVASVPSVCDAIAAQVPEALLLRLPEEDGVVCLEAMDTILGRQEKIDAAVFGPGLTHDEPVRALLEQLWPQWNKPALLDADALNAISMGAESPAGVKAMTPHPGELARLLNTTVPEIQADRFASARRAARELGCPVLLKGAYTVSASPGQPLLVNPTGNSGMAAGGMGDALSGVVGTLLAQGMSGIDALAAGAYWHGMAGDLCMAEIGPIGYTATDLIDRLPRARAAMAG